MALFWAGVLAISTLLYVLLDGFDLGVGILFGLTRDEARRRSMISAVAPVWDGNETWLVVTGVVLWGAFPIVYATLLSALYLPLLAHAGGADPARRRLRVPQQDGAAAVGMGRLLCRRLVRRRIRAGNDSWRFGRGAPDRQWPLYWR